VGVATKTDGNGTQKPTIKERLVNKLGETGAVLHDAVSAVVDEKLTATAQDRASALEAASTAFSRQVKGVSERLEGVEKAVADISAAAGTATTKSEEAKIKADTAETSAKETATKVETLGKNLSGEISDIVAGADERLTTEKVQKGPEEFLGYLLEKVNEVSSMLVVLLNGAAEVNANINARLDELETAVADLGSKLGGPGK